MRLEDHVAALAALGTEHDDDVAAATRLRIRSSLERGHAWRRHASTLAALAILLVASGAWALATGRLQRWVGRPQAPVIAPAPAAPLPSTSTTLSLPAVVPAASQPTATTTPSAPPPHIPTSSAPKHLRTTVATKSVETTSDDDRLYARAHELHFRGGAPADALAAWDAYLAAAPHGAFAIEARYNRALCLVRLGRLADARTALEPFARGAIEPAGYRQSDAAHLIERIDHRLNGSK